MNINIFILTWIYNILLNIIAFCWIIYGSIEFGNQHENWVIQYWYYDTENSFGFSRYIGNMLRKCWHYVELRFWIIIFKLGHIVLLPVDGILTLSQYSIRFDSYWVRITISSFAVSDTPNDFQGFSRTFTVDFA